MTSERPLLTRSFTIEIGDPQHSPEWQSLNSGSPIRYLQGCSFDVAEEVIGLVEYEDGTYIVGIGEPLRPFNLLYRGKRPAAASKVFIQAIIGRAR